jgi:hypothetical protein
VKVPYTSVTPLANLVLEESWVLRIIALPGQVEYDVEFVLSPFHPDYVPPRDGEMFCYRKGRLLFGAVSDLRWSGQGEAPARDASGELDFGNIDSMVVDGSRFELSGSWGEMTVIAEVIDVTLGVT